MKLLFILYFMFWSGLAIGITVEATKEEQSAIAKGGRMVPVTENGTQLGYLMKDIEPGGLYERIGLRNGDIVAGIDENRDPSSLIRDLYKKLRTHEEFTLYLIPIDSVRNPEIRVEFIYENQP